MPTDANAMFNDVFTRLRETEAQTREQQVRIDSVLEKIENQNERISGFTRIIDSFIIEIKQREDRSERRERNFWKVIYVLLATVVSLALGKQVAKEIITSAINTKVPVASYYIAPIAPMPDNNLHPLMNGGSNGNRTTA